MFKRWFRKFFSVFKKKKTLDTTHLTVPATDKSEIKKIVTKKERTTKGYRTSPYDNGFSKPEKGADNNQTLNPNLSKDSTPTPEPTPSIHKTTTIGSINFYETVESTSPVQVSVSEPIVASVESPVSLAEQPQANIVVPQDGKLFVMNGYGVNVELNSGEHIVAYLDTGEDKNIEVNAQVVLSHWNGPLDKTTGKIISATDTERPGTSDDVLIQNV